MSQQQESHKAIECGVPDPFQYMHPMMAKNHGQWDWHDRPRPGVLHHVSKSHVRFTIRSNIEFMVSSKDKVDPLIEKLGIEGFPVGGTGNSMSMIAHTQGFLHCDIPATDASGVVKSLMDELHHEFVNEEMPNRVRISTSCCQINCGGQADISINIQHTKPPRINHDLVANICERPAVVARCPVAAIRPAMVDGKPSFEVDERKCICCGARHTFNHSTHIRF